MPTAIFGFDLFMAGVAYYILVQYLIKLHGKDSTLGRAVGSDAKGVISVIVYAAGIALAFVEPEISISLYALVAVMWLIPDKRIERRLREEEK